MNTAKIYYNNGDKELIVMAIDNCENVLLEGESGTGKTSMIKEIAQERGKNLIRINLNGQVGVEEIIGYKTMNDGNVSFVEGALVEAMKRGDWIVFDELNAANPEVLFTLQSLLDDDRFIVLKEWNNTRVDAHPDFRFFATQNPPTNYAGTKELNPATLSRFGIVLKVDYSDREAEILSERTGIDSALANGLVACANTIREQTKKGELTALCTTRDLLQVSKLITLGVDKLDALEVAIVNKAKPEEREELKKIFELNLDVRFKVEVNGKPIAVTAQEADEIEKKLNKKVKDFEKAKKELEENLSQIEEAFNKNSDETMAEIKKELTNLINDSSEKDDIKKKMTALLDEIIFTE